MTTPEQAPTNVTPEGVGQRRRRVKTKLPAAGPGPALRTRWNTQKEELHQLIKETGYALVGEGIIPTLPHVIERALINGAELTEATAGRHSDILKPVRALWEEKHERVHQWHRRPREKRLPVDPIDTRLWVKDQLQQEKDKSSRLEAQLKEALARLKACDESKKALLRERTDLKLQIQRLELPIIDEALR